MSCIYYESYFFLNPELTPNLLQTMLPIYTCRASGASMNQLMHYAGIIKYKYFGRFVSDTINPAAYENTQNYTLSNVSASIALFYSLGDATTSLNEMAKLRSAVQNVVYEKLVDDLTFAHFDFAMGMNANDLVYVHILKAFKKFGR